MNAQSPNPPSSRPDVDAPAIEVTYSESDALRRELAEQKDSHLRLAADFENFKKRSRQESESRAVAQKELFIVELLPVIDNLERALTAGASKDAAVAAGFCWTWQGRGTRSAPPTFPNQ